MTTIGEEHENEIYIRLAEGEGEQHGDLISTVTSTLRSHGDPSKVDLNVADAATIRGALEGAGVLASSEAAALAAAISTERKSLAIFHSLFNFLNICLTT